MSSTDSDESIHSNSKHHKCSKKRKRKLEKKHKKQKKEKRHKEKKRLRRSSSSSSSTDSSKRKQSKSLNVFGVESRFGIPTSVEVECANVESFGPALPPHLCQSDAAVPVIIGPQIPSNLNAVLASIAEVESVAEKQTTAVSTEEPDEEDLTDIYGPIPLSMDSNNQTHLLSAAQIELEQRALELKLAAIEGANCKPVDQKVREEWMLELPDVGLKGGLAALSNMKRKFHHGKEKPDFSDRSDWTKTPQAEGNTTTPANPKITAETMLNDAQAIFERQRDEEQESIARKHKKKHKRDESLVEMHQKKLRKEQKQKEKELAAAGAKPERRPFSRDVDLKLNKIDKNQTKSIVDKAKVLNTKFSTGHTKYL